MAGKGKLHGEKGGDKGDGKGGGKSGETGTPNGFAGPYRLVVLGRVELTSIRGDVVGLPRGKPLALLIFLAFHPDGVERDELARVLWGEKDLPKGRQSVRQALSQLRKDLGPEVFFSDDPVRLVPGVVHTDLGELRAAVEEGEVDKALALWQGEPLSGLSVSGGRWAEWAGEVGDSWKRILVSGLEERGLERVREGELDLAIEELRRATKLVPDRVESWAHLVEVQIDFGRVREARTCLADAWRHLDPGVYEERLGPLERRMSMGPDAALLDGEGGIVARESDVAAIAAGWRLAKEGRTEVAFFEGVEGVGKTRLLEEAGKPVVTPGAQIVRAATEGKGPWAAAAEWTEGLGAMPGAEGVTPESAEVLASFLGVGEGGSSSVPKAPSSEGELADAFFDLLGSVALSAPTLLSIDNAERLDPESWRLLRRLVRLRPSFPLLVCLGWDSSKSGEAARLEVVDWVGKGWAALRRLRPFTQDEVDSLIRLRGWKDDEIVEEAGRQVFDKSQGHPELVLGFLKVLEENRLRPPLLSDEPQPIPDLNTLPLSEPLLEFYGKKVEDLPESAFELLRVLGIADHATISTLAYSTGLEAAEAESILEELEKRGIVEQKEEGVGLVNRSLSALAKERTGPPVPAQRPSPQPGQAPFHEKESVPAGELEVQRILSRVGRTMFIVIFVAAMVWAFFFR